MDIKTAYLVGSFSGWRDEYTKNPAPVNFNDPRNHDQTSIARLDCQDLGGAANSDVSIVNVPAKGRIGTMSYSEVGVAYASGKPVLIVNPLAVRDEVLDAVKSAEFYNIDKLYSAIRIGAIYPKGSTFKVDKKVESKEPYRSVMFVGDDSQNVAELRDLVSKCRKQIVCPPFPAPTDLADKLDLMVVNFDSGKKHDPKALFYMGVADATGVPVLLLEGNSIPYPPLLGLARRVLFGECRFEQAIEYLSNLGSQHISDEALVYYDLMKKFNK